MNPASVAAERPVDALRYRLVLPDGWVRLAKGAPGLAGQLSRAATALGPDVRSRARVESALATMVESLGSSTADVHLPTEPVSGVRMTLMFAVDLIAMSDLEGVTEYLAEEAAERVEGAARAERRDPGTGERRPAAESGSVADAPEEGQVAEGAEPVAGTESPDHPGDLQALAAAYLERLALGDKHSQVLELAGQPAVRVVTKLASAPHLTEAPGGERFGEEDLTAERIVVRYVVEGPPGSGTLLIVSGYITELAGAQEFAEAEIEFFDAVLTTLTWS